VSQAAILGIPISMETPSQVLDSVAERISAKISGGYICITNTESMYHALRRPDHLRYIQGAQHSLCDGVGVIVAGWSWGLRIRRYNGPIFQLDCTRRGAAEGWRHFYFGGEDGVPEEMARRLQASFPGSICAGTYSPPFRPLTAEEDQAMVDLINQTKPDLVWVGLGLVKQEQWIADHLGRIQAPWMIGVGGAFDYHSGNVPWAPPVLRRVGLEWLFRLLLQPRLRARRYWWSLLFVLEATARGALRRLTRPASPDRGEVA
jgi:N-acetylglucosaminyldiphosphoundecaprenol N-acetyl-beta-D-mannosaminyltransferase